jgi:hypothetical protein
VVRTRVVVRGHSLLAVMLNRSRRCGGRRRCVRRRLLADCGLLHGRQWRSPLGHLLLDLFTVMRRRVGVIQRETIDPAVICSNRHLL